MIVNRKSHEERFDYLIKTYGSGIETLQGAAQNVDRELQPTIHGRIEHLREKHRILRDKYDQLKNAEDSIWEDLRTVVEGVLDEVDLNLVKTLCDLVRYRYRL